MVCNIYNFLDSFLSKGFSFSDFASSASKVAFLSFVIPETIHFVLSHSLEIFY